MSSSQEGYYIDTSIKAKTALVTDSQSQTAVAAEDICAGASQAPAYLASPVVFDGTNDGMLNGVPGIPTQAVAISIWYRKRVPSLQTSVLLAQQQNGVVKSFVFLSGTDLIVQLSRNNPHSDVLLSFIVPVPNDANWHLFQVSAYTKSGIGTLSGWAVALDDQDITSTITPTINNLNLLTLGLKFSHDAELTYIGSYGEFLHFDGDLADVYYGTGATVKTFLGVSPDIHFSDPSNRRKFVDAGGKPVFLGKAGLIPSPRSEPADIVLFGPASNFANNFGKKGNFIFLGSLGNGTVPVQL